MNTEELREQALEHANQLQLFIDHLENKKLSTKTRNDLDRLITAITTLFNDEQAHPAIIADDYARVMCAIESLRIIICESLDIEMIEVPEQIDPDVRYMIYADIKLTCFKFLNSLLRESIYYHGTI